MRNHGRRELHLGGEGGRRLHPLPPSGARDRPVPLRLPVLLVLRHRPQHAGAHLPLRQVGSGLEEEVLILAPPTDPAHQPNPTPLLSPSCDQRGVHPSGQQLLHQLGQEDVLRPEGHPGPGQDHHPQRGAGPDQIHLQRQDGNPDAEHHDLQQVLHQRTSLR